jgi:hypothetical protein
MKMINRLLMIALVSSVFFGCSKDEDPKDDLPKAGISATYRGEFIVNPQTADAYTIPNVSIEITYNSGKDSATLKLDLKSILSNLPTSSPVSVACAITSTKDNYSLSGEKSVAVPEMGNIGVKVENTSEVDKSGKTTINITATMATQGGGTVQIPVKFEGVYFTRRNFVIYSPGQKVENSKTKA